MMTLMTFTSGSPLHAQTRAKIQKQYVTGLFKAERMSRADPTETPRRIPLAIFQHELKGHPTRTAHWCLVALFSLQKATIFELVGNTDTYGYVCSETNKFHTSYPSLRGGVKVGSVPEDQRTMDWLKGILATIDIHKHDIGRFDCQFWVLAALKMLGNSELGGAKEHGVLLDGLNEAAIRMELLEERERWERGDDTFHEREYSSCY